MDILNSKSEINEYIELIIGCLKFIDKYTILKILKANNIPPNWIKPKRYSNKISEIDNEMNIMRSINRYKYIFFEDEENIISSKITLDYKKNKSNYKKYYKDIIKTFELLYCSSNLNLSFKTDSFKSSYDKLIINSKNKIYKIKYLSVNSYKYDLQDINEDSENSDIVIIVLDRNILNNYKSINVKIGIYYKLAIYNQEKDLVLVRNTLKELRELI